MRALLVLAAFSVSALLSSYAAAQTQPTQIPALQAEIETVYTLPDGREIRNTGHLYRSRTGQVREDSPLGAVITDVAAGTVTILIAETKEARVMRIPADQRMRRPVPSNRPAPEVFEETTVSGHRVAKARTKGPQGQRVEFWTAKDLGVVTWMKKEAAGGFTTTKKLRNLSTEEPDSAMFAIPADYTVIEQEATPGDGPEGLPLRPGRPNRR
jgi:hypothetical protein